MAVVGDIGTGEAFVVDFSNLNNTLNRQFAEFDRQAKERQRQIQEQNAQIGQLVSSINLNGVRREDQATILKGYKELREKAMTAQSITDPYQKSLALAEIQNGYADMNAAINGSKQVGTFFAERGKDILDHPELYGEDIVEKFRANMAKPSGSLTGEDLDPTTYLKKPDTSKVYTSIVDGLQKIVKGQAGKSSAGESFRVGNQTVTQVNTVQSLPTGAASNWILKYAQANPQAEVYLKETYPDMNIGEAAINLAQELDQIGALSNVDTRTQNNARPRSTGGGGESQNAATYRQQIITDLLDPSTPPQQVKQTMEEINAYLPQGSKIEYKTAADGNRYLDVSVAADRSRGVRATTQRIDLQFGDPANRINSLINQYTGERINPRQLNIQKGKPTGNRVSFPNQNNSVNSQRNNDPLGLGF